MATLSTTHATTRPVAVAALLLAAFTLGACDRRGPQTPATTAAETPASGGVVGVVPQSNSTLPASDRPGAPAVGAMEAGQAGTSRSGGTAAPTGGDGAASAPAAGASR